MELEVAAILMGTNGHQDCVRAEEILTSTNVDGWGPWGDLQLTEAILYQGISICDDCDVSLIDPVTVCCI